MKKTFRRRAPRKKTTRKGTHGGRKLRKMRGGFGRGELKNDGTGYVVLFERDELNHVKDLKKTNKPPNDIYDMLFKEKVNNTELDEELKQKLKTNIIERIQKIDIRDRNIDGDFV